MHRLLLALVLLLAACGDAGGDDAASAAERSSAAAATAPPAHETAVPSPQETSPQTAGDGCAHVIAGEIVWQGETATVSATVRSADTGWDKYADAWEVRAPGGEVWGVRELAHPHETEQPVTRSLSAVVSPDEISEVVLAAHDSVDGWCGDTLTLPVPDRQ